MAHAMIERMVAANSMLPRHETADRGRHIFRELNREADAPANKHSNGSSIDWDNCRYRYYRLFFDGSVAAHGCGACVASLL